MLYNTTMKHLFPISVLFILFAVNACISNQFDTKEDFEYRITAGGKEIEIRNVIEDCKGDEYADAFDNGFDVFYITNGKKAGTYMLENGQWRMR